MTHHKRNLALLAATTLVVAACSSSNNDRATGPAANQAPTIAAVADQSVDQDTVVGPIQISIADQETSAAELNVIVGTDSPNVFPSDGIVLSGTGATRTLTLTPREAATGVTTVAVLVTDGSNASATQTFRVTVNARPASVKAVALSTFAKGESDEPTIVNGFTFTQDADDPATFEALIPADTP